MTRVLFVCIFLMVCGPLPATGSQGGAHPASSSAATNEAQSSPKPTVYPLSRYFELGGIFMYPLLLLAAAGLALITERMIHNLRHKSGGDGFAAGLIATARRGEDPLLWCRTHPACAMSAIFERALSRHAAGGGSPEIFEREVETLAAIDIAARERNLALLASIANLAPLVGFLGTVTGMIGAFGSIAAADSVSARVVSSGIFEALITTAAGLIIAIPAFAFHNYAVHRIDRLASTIEKTAAELSASLADTGKLR